MWVIALANNIPEIITEEDLKTQKLVINDKNIEVKNPVDSVTEELLRNLKVGLFVIEYMGVRVYPRKSGSYPNPTLMDFALVRYLKNQGLKSKKVLDLGSGLGFRGNFAAKYLEPEEIVFGDINPLALNQSLENYFLNHPELARNYDVKKHSTGALIKAVDQTIDLRLGDVSQTLANYDAEGQIALAAPYFIPGFCTNFPQAFSLFAEVAKKTGARLLIGHSNTANKLVEEAASKHGLSLTSRIEQEVPFLVEYSDPKEHDEIPDGLIFKDGVPYHKLMVSELYFKSNS